MSFPVSEKVPEPISHDTVFKVNQSFCFCKNISCYCIERTCEVDPMCTFSRTEADKISFQHYGGALFLHFMSSVLAVLKKV